MHTSEQPARVRIDKWLWAARFFKTRAQAADAVSGGHVHINGERSKPSHGIKAGDVLKITKAGYTFLITVIVLAERRGSAQLAQRLYQEAPESIARREQQGMMHRLNAMASPRPSKRPDKRQRRQLKGWLAKP
jgi:ribosome-associated heat shock protein Hsp15